MLLDMVCRIPSECVLQLHSTRDRQAVSTFLPFSICAIYYTLSRLPQGKLGSDYIGLVRERGLGTLWCRRRPAAADGQSTGLSNLMGSGPPRFSYVLCTFLMQDSS